VVSGGSPAGRSLPTPGFSPDLQRSEPGRCPAGTSSSPLEGIRCGRSREAFRGFGTEDGNWMFHTVSVVGTLSGKPQAGGWCGGRGQSFLTADGQEVLGGKGDGTADMWWHARTHTPTHTHTHTFSQANSGTHAHTHPPTHTHTLSQANTGPSTQKGTHTPTVTDTHAHTHTYSHTQANTGPSTYSDRSIHPQLQIHTHILTHRQMQIQAHIQRVTHTHAVTYTFTSTFLTHMQIHV